MVILTIYQDKYGINYHIYQLFNKNPTIREYGKITFLDNQLIWNIYNSQSKLTNQVILPILETSNKYQIIAANELISQYNVDIILYKISCGGDIFQQICRITNEVLSELQNLVDYSPQEQHQDIILTQQFIHNYTQAKHYTCFDSGFHATPESKFRSLILNQDKFNANNIIYGSMGLIFESIASRIIYLSDKKIAKGRWVIAYLENNITTLCAIKKSRSIYCTTSGVHTELPPAAIPTHNLETSNKFNFNSVAEWFTNNSLENTIQIEYYTSSLANGILKLINELGGIDGLIFSGTLGMTSPELRRILANKLSWIGLELANKANLENHCKLHKKESLIKIFALNAEPEQAMLEQFIERL